MQLNVSVHLNVWKDKLNNKYQPDYHDDEDYDYNLNLSIYYTTTIYYYIYYLQLTVG